MSPGPPRRGVRERLAFRLAFLLAVVLLPLTLISVVKTLAVLEEARARSEAALMGETMQAASGELRLINQTRGAAATLAHTIAPVLDDPATCNDLLARLLAQQQQYSLIAFVPEDGMSTCNSARQALDFADDPLFARATTEQRAAFAVKAVGLMAGAPVLEVAHPVIDGTTGLYRGFVSLSLPHSGLRGATGGAELRPPLTMITFDRRGTILTSSRQFDELGVTIPRDRPLATLAGEETVSFSGQASNGEPRVFSVVPLVPNELFALGSWPPEGAMTPNGGVFGAVPSVLFPVLMWLASLVVAWLAVERLVIRHIRKLRRSLISFSGGNRIVGDISTAGAPLEIRDMGEAYARMTETILHDEAEMEDMVHQKEVLLREVHHRVKNNLQLIASIMNMQMRRTHSAEAKTIMRGLQDRVMSLATIHHELYQTAGLSDVHADELLATIVRQITNLADRPDRRFRVETDFDSIHTVPDQAVPLALLVAEAVTNALKYAAEPEPGRPAELWVSFKRVGDSRAALRVCNTMGPAGTDPAGDETTGRVGLGTQLVQAFAMQLGATVERNTEDGVYELIITFALRPLSDAEERHAVAGEAPAEPD